MGEVRTVFKSELDKQVTQEVRADKDNKIHQDGKGNNNGDNAEDDDDDDHEGGGDKVGGNSRVLTNFRHK